MQPYRDKIKVGTIKILKAQCLQNPPGTKGVCYWVYGNDKHQGYGFIFPNGNYDGFGVEQNKISTTAGGTDYDDIDSFFEEGEAGYDLRVSRYRFTNSVILSQDFRNGIFDIALGIKKERV